MTYTKKIIHLMKYGESLKNVNRAGWTIAGLESKRYESVAEHSYGSIMTSIIIGQYLRTCGVEISLEKISLMATLHDLPESITGDIARTEQFLENPQNIRVKELAEQTAIKTIFDPLGESFHNFIQLWNEFNSGESIEARIVRGADILDMLLHARSLEQSGVSPQILHQFFTSSLPILESISIRIITDVFNELFESHLQEARERGLKLK